MTSLVQVRDALAEVNASGKFVRTAASFRNIVSHSNEIFKPEFGRYHLYGSMACPWANRCVAALKLKGLQDCIGLTVAHPTWQRTMPESTVDTHCGWAFHDSNDASLPPLSQSKGYGAFVVGNCTPDTLNNAKFIRDLYEMSHDTTGKYSVPVLWDKTNACIVNNESSEIVRMFTSAFDEWATGPMAELDLYPEALRSEIDAVNEWVYPGINDGVYKCGFATSQGAYDDAVKELYSALDRLEGLLSSQRYLVGNNFTEADIRLFMTLVRFDEVYVVYFKCNKKRIADYPCILNYCRDLYQLHCMAECIDMEHIKIHYFSSHPHLNTYAIVPAGPDVLADLILPHDRNTM